METVDEVVTVVTKIHTLAAKLINFKDDWVDLSDDYQQEVELLTARRQNYQRLSRLHGQQVGGTMMIALKNAENTLQRAVSRLEGFRNLTSNTRCCSHLRLCWAKFWIALFPENIEKNVKKVNEKIDNILKSLKNDAEVGSQMQKGSNMSGIRTQMDDYGDLYIPIKNTQAAVMQEIDDPQGHHIILLHGGFGKGKSTLAKYMVHCYGQDSESCSEEDRERKKIFEDVIWVSCASLGASCSQAEIMSKQFEILQHHSPESLGDSLSKDKPEKNKIFEALERFFGSKRIFVILDDVSNHIFLRQMWKAAAGGKGVKYLVTSQWKNICSKAGLGQLTQHVKMEDPTDDEAMTILASHVGLKPIPWRLQGIAKRIIEATEKNPLASACVASHFANSEDKTDEREWKDALSELDTLLKKPENSIVLDLDTPRSLWAAMTFCVNTLQTENGVKILLLMYECKVAWVPESILRIFIARLKKSTCTFTETRGELVMRELLKPAMHSEAKGQKDSVEHKAWALGSLVKQYIKEYPAGDKVNLRSMICELLRDKGQESKSGAHYKHEDKVVIILCALYFDQSHFDVYQLVENAMIQVGIDHSNVSFDNVTLQAMEPLIHLLDKAADQDQNWNESEVHCVRQVFLTYTCNRQLDDDNISHLLELEACSEAQLATLKALSVICLREKTSLFHQNNLKFLQALVRLMASNQGPPSTVQRAASTTLRLVCWKAAKELSSPLVIDSPGLLDFLVSSLLVPDDQLATEAALALQNLAYQQDSNLETIRSKDGALVGLVQCLFKHNQPRLQEAAAVVIGNLAQTPDTSILWSIASQDGALVALVMLLSAHDKPDVQKHAAIAFRNLADTEDDSLRLRITNEDGALAGLVHCLQVSEHPGVQEQAATAFTNLGNTLENSIHWSIGSQDGAVGGLVKLLSTHDKPEVQKYAAMALRNLADTEDDSLRLRIASEEGTLTGLVHCLQVSEHPDVQEQAAAALANLGSTLESSILWSIASQDGAIVGLVKLLSAHDKPEVQEQAATALRSLANTEDDSLKLRIASEEGALAGLVDCLQVSEHPSVQFQATFALASLAKAEEAKTVLERTEGLLEGLTSLLEDGMPWYIQYFGAHALTLINSTMGKEAILTIGNAYLGRGDALNYMEMHAEALPDLAKGIELLQGSDTFALRQGALSSRCFTKAKLCDFTGALVDANEAVNSNRTAFALKERGVLKWLMGDPEGALADLNHGLKLETDDYETLKHRGYVKFLLKDEDGARADAEWALRIKPSSVDLHNYKKSTFLGAISVEYLGYKLK